VAPGDLVVKKNLSTNDPASSKCALEQKKAHSGDGAGFCVAECAFGQNE
jgi:hypothetical protein